MDPAKIAIKASTQEYLEIEDIQEGLVILKDGSCCLVLSTTAINFGLLSEQEQEATIFAYAALLNSLTFQIQILIRSTKKDISSYINLLADREAKEKRNLIKEQIGKYRQFIQETVRKNNVLDKKFYLVIPMSGMEVGGVKNISLPIKKTKNTNLDKGYIVQQARVNLYPKRDHLLRQLSRLGLKSHQLDSQELIKLFFDIYNPELAGQQMADSGQYVKPLVKTATPPVTEVTEKTELQKKEPEINLNQPKKETSIHNKINNLVKNETTIS